MTTARYTTSILDNWLRVQPRCRANASIARNQQEMRIIRGPLTIIFVALVILLLIGCAPKTEEMIANHLPNVFVRHDSVIVVVSGGNYATLLNSALVPDKNFSTALVESLRKMGMFRSVQTSGGALYKLDAILENFSRVTGPPSATFGLKVDWRLIRAPDQVVWRAKTTASFSGPLRPTFVDLEHLRMAAEKAARENIEQALSQLALLNF
jgi:hypothetical protein